MPSRCPLCQERLKLLGVGAARCNVVLCGLLEKCVERETRVDWLVTRVRDRLTRGDTREALRMAQKGVELGKHHRARWAGGTGWGMRMVGARGQPYSQDGDAPAVPLE